jgi:VWFA-related protein
MLRFLSRCLLAGFVCTSMSAPGQSTSTEPITTLHTSSKLVVVDVVVTDSKQDPIHHLAASDFLLSEDGHAQKIKIFEEHTSDTPAPVQPLPKLPPGKFTNYSVVPANGALNILLLDKLNTPMDAQQQVRDQILKYLKEAPAGTRIAIFGLTTQLKMLQGFTSDPELLRQLVSGKKASEVASPLLNSGSGSNNLGMDTMANASDAITGDAPDNATIMSALQEFDAQQESFQSMLRARYTLDAFNQLARYLSTLPGRKNLIWFSGSFPINILPDGDQQDPFSAMATAEDEYRDTVNLLTRSQVAVYPIDARELMVSPTLNASNTARPNLKNPIAADNSFYKQIDNEHNTMNTMAEDTGGKAFINTNDLKGAVSKAIEAGSNYYMLAYTPTNRDEKGEFRKIEIKLDHPGAKLAYRRGYFTDEPATSRHHDAAQDAQSTTNNYNPVRAAMLHGAPAPQQLVFVADVRPTNTDTESVLAPGNQVVDPKTAGPFHRYTSTFVVNPKDLSCDALPDGQHHCEAEFLTFVYDSDGKLVNMQMNDINASFSSEKYADFLKKPLAYRQQVSVPVKGEYYLRLGLYDEMADHVGALELPVAVAAKLPPAPPQVPASGTAPAAGTTPK